MAGIACTNCGRTMTPKESGSPCPVCGSRDRLIAAFDEAFAIEKASRDHAAKELAHKHYQLEPGITHVIRFSRQDEAELVHAEPIKLLEVNAHTVTSGIMPLRFGPEPESGLPYPTVIVEVTPEEFEKIKRSELKLPEGWEMEEELPRPPDKTGAA